MVNPNRFKGDYMVCRKYKLRLNTDIYIFWLMLQSVNYIAEHVVGTGSFGTVYQVQVNFPHIYIKRFFKFFFCFVTNR